jgi:hypothetical protein
MEDKMRPNCVEVQRAAPHKKGRGRCSCRVGNFYNIFGNHWEFRSNNKPMNEDDLMEVMDTLKALKMDPIEKKLHGVIMDHMYTCIEEGLAIKPWMDHLASLEICVHTTLPDLIRSSIGMAKQKSWGVDPDKVESGNQLRKDINVQRDGRKNHGLRAIFHFRRKRNDQN